MRTTTQFSEAGAWREIARRIDANGCQFGLCNEARRLKHEERLSWDDEDRMTSRATKHVYGMPRRERFGAYIAKPGQAPVRVLAALFLALEAEDEGR